VTSSLKARGSLRRYLLAGIVVPITLFVLFDTVGSYRSSLAALHAARCSPPHARSASCCSRSARS